MEGWTVVFLGRVRNSGGFGLVFTIATGASSSETEPRDSSSGQTCGGSVTKQIEAGASTRRIAFLAVFSFAIFGLRLDMETLEHLSAWSKQTRCCQRYPKFDFSIFFVTGFVACLLHCCLILDYRALVFGDLWFAVVGLRHGLRAYRY